MKRHEAIAPLSREHHANLILAQVLKSHVADYKGMPTSPTEKRIYAIRIFNGEIKHHFKKEEKMFALIYHHAELKEMIDEISNEHRILEELFLNLPEDKTLPVKLNFLGITLDNHIRKEERVLFPKIQEICSEEELNSIAELF